MSSIGPRCTVWLKGSRTFKRRTILSVTAWITAISSPRRKRVQALQQRRPRPFKSERLDGGPRCRQRIAWKINAIEFPVVFATVLKMIVDLQAGAERVRGRPGRRALAMDVEHEPSDRHCRVSA